MENNNNNNKNKSFIKKLFSSNGSVIASFAIAIIGIVSLVAFGFSQISYAIPDVENPLPDTFKTKSFVTSTDLLMSDTWTGHQIDMHYAIVDNENVPVFCLQQSVPFCDGDVYTKGEVVNDAGLLYLMANLYPHKTMTPSYTVENGGLNNNKQIETWITQAAIWVYLTETSTESQYNALTADDLSKIRSTRAITFSRSYSIDVNPDKFTGYVTSNHTLFDGYKVNGKTINELITKAETFKGQAATSLTVSKNSDTISVTSDEKYYQTDLISVAGSVSDEAIGQFNGYKLTIKNAPDGTLIVDENGEEIKDLTNMVPGTKFYVRIPVDKVTEETKNVSISVEGSFKSYTGNRYVADGCQTITAVKTVNNNISQPLDIEINYTPDVPDTGMSTAQSIYFIGLIVLLCGIGIIYANVKPRKSN